MRRQIACGGGAPSPVGDKAGGGEGSFGLKHCQSRGGGSVGQARAPSTAAAHSWSGCLEKGCSLHLGGLGKVGTCIWGGGRRVGASRIGGKSWLPEGKADTFPRKCVGTPGCGALNAWI